MFIRLATDWMIFYSSLQLFLSPKKAAKIFDYSKLSVFEKYQILSKNDVVTFVQLWQKLGYFFIATAGHTNASD